MQNKKYKITYQRNRGFIALLTIVIASIILTMIMGISSLAVKQSTLSMSAREGSKAFFAADAGIECALYWDVHKVTANNTSYFDSTNTPPQVISCAGGSYNIYAPIKTNPPSPPSLPLATYDSYNFDLSLGQTCARVLVSKDYPVDDDQNGAIDVNKELYTQVRSLGYNVPCASVPSNPPNLVERGIQTTY